MFYHTHGEHSRDYVGKATRYTFFDSMSDKSTCDVAIIGGGVIGLSCAWRIAQRGVKVHLFERGEGGKEASWAAAGMLAPQVEAAVHPPQEPSTRRAFFDLCLQSRALYPALAAELLDVTGIDIELSLREYARGDWRTPGILFVGEKNGEAFGELEKQRAQNFEIEAVPNFNERHAWWLPQEGQVENRKLVAALKTACERSDVEIFEHHDFQSTALESKTNFGRAIICGGAWSSQIAPFPMPLVRAVAGEMLALRSKCELDHVVYSRSLYLVPRRDGRVLAGATMQERGFDKTATAAAREALLQAARALFPRAQNWPVEDHWAGCRPAAPDGLPILGSTPLENLFIATGHFRNGILLTPVTAQLMADCVLDGHEPPREFSLERFASGVLAS